MTFRPLFTLLAVGAALTSVACIPTAGQDGGQHLVAGEDGGPAAQVPDFTLVDVNATSASFESQISPRDYIGRISVWYFGHAT